MRLQGLSDEVVAELRKGDKRCPIPVGAKVTKIKASKEDRHKNGTKGIVNGSLLMNINGHDTECYIVLFKGDELDSLMIGKNLKLESKSTS